MASSVSQTVTASDFLEGIRQVSETFLTGASET